MPHAHARIFVSNDAFESRARMSFDARALTDTRECDRLFAFGMGKQYDGSRTADAIHQIATRIPGAAPSVFVDDDVRGRVVSLERPGGKRVSICT